MSDSIKITTIPIEDWKKYRDLRLEALKDSPVAFSSSYEDESSAPDEKWKERLQNAHDEKTDFILFAKSGDKLVGMVRAFRSQEIKIKHIATIYGVYVNPQFRFQRLGAKLLENFINKLKKHPQIVKIKISVVTENSVALKLYQKLGFSTVGKDKKELFVNNRYYDEYRMEMIVK